jgi:hypothetical protein
MTRAQTDARESGDGRVVIRTAVHARETEAATNGERAGNVSDRAASS